MYCKQCGSQMDDGVLFCPSCGAKNENQAAPAQTVGAQTAAPVSAAKPANKNIGLIAAAALGLIVLILLISLLSGRSLKSTVNSAIKNTFKGKIEKVIDLLPMDALKKGLKDEGMTIKEYKDGKKEYFEEVTKETKLRLVKYEIVDTEDLTQAQIGSIADQLKTKKIKDGKEVTVHVTYRKDGDLREKDMTLDLVKIGNKWSLSPGSLFSLFLVYGF